DFLLSGFSIGVEFDGTFLEVLEVTLDGTEAEGAELIFPNINNDSEPAGSWWTLGVVLDVEGMFLIPPDIDSVITKSTYEVESFTPAGTVLEISPEEGVGEPSVDLVFVTELGQSVTPVPVSGEMTIGEGLFVRGDTNNDGSVNVADPVFNLEYQFNMGPSFCLDAQDTNDDGQLNLADPIYNLNYQFSEGPAPPAPFPSAGSDPTGDTLGCDL
ncbi:MAG: hypothetical protein V3T77_07720, partial [Planctomycetota bacterium]